jgi:GGDEF domain-containing protein
MRARERRATWLVGSDELDRLFEIYQRNIARLGSFRSGVSKAEAVLDAAAGSSPSWDPFVGSAALRGKRLRGRRDDALLALWHEEMDADAAAGNDIWPWNSGHPPNPIQFYATGLDGIATLLEHDETVDAQRAIPVLRQALLNDSLASFEPWSGFGLWLVSQEPTIAELVEPALFVLAEAQAAEARLTPIPIGWGPGMSGMVVPGAARLIGLRRLGVGIDAYASIRDAVLAAQCAPGLWPRVIGDNEPDLLATMVGAEAALLFDAQSPRTWPWILAQQSDDGMWWDRDHLGTWLTSKVLRLGELRTSRPVSWPALRSANRDAKTGIAAIGHFRVCSETMNAGSPTRPIDVFFFDLANFKAFNDARGQAEGDRCLREFATMLADRAGAVAIRDGGDEFILLMDGASADVTSVCRELDAAWLARFARAFPGAPTVRARGLMTRVRPYELNAARKRLGFEIGALKSKLRGHEDDPHTRFIRPLAK